jgi:hypothetical protein
MYYGKIFCVYTSERALSIVAGRDYFAIDLKSFYASVECVDRGLDALSAHLVVADLSRTEKTICLAVTPALKAYGIAGRARLFEVVQRVKEINRQRQAIRDYGRTKEVYTQYRESGWSVKFYQEHRQEIEDHKKAQAVYSSLDGKMPTLKELTAEYDSLKEQKENNQSALDELKPKLTDLKHIRYNYEILERDSAPNSHQHVIPKDHHYDEHAVHHDDESRLFAKQPQRLRW